MAIKTTDLAVPKLEKKIPLNNCVSKVAIFVEVERDLSPSPVVHEGSNTVGTNRPRFERTRLGLQGRKKRVLFYPHLPISNC